MQSQNTLPRNAYQPISPQKQRVKKYYPYLTYSNPQDCGKKAVSQTVFRSTSGRVVHFYRDCHHIKGKYIEVCWAKNKKVCHSCSAKKQHKKYNMSTESLERHLFGRIGKIRYNNYDEPHTSILNFFIESVRQCIFETGEDDEIRKFFHDLKLTEKPQTEILELLKNNHNSVIDAVLTYLEKQFILFGLKKANDFITHSDVKNFDSSQWLNHLNRGKLFKFGNVLLDPLEMKHRL